MRPLVAVISAVRSYAVPHAQTPAEPLAIARILAAKYPAQPIMSYIPALSWSGAFAWPPSPERTAWREKPRRTCRHFCQGTRRRLPNRTALPASPATSHSPMPARSTATPRRPRSRKRPPTSSFRSRQTRVIRFPRKWTDDMFMATAVLARVGGDTKDPSYGAAAGRLLTSYAETLQRPDGLFIHALEGPHAWGRGNGFALLGVTEALTYLPDSWPDRAACAGDLSQAHARARHPPVRRWQLAAGRGRAHQLSRVDGDRDDGGRHGARRRLGWIDRSAYEPIIDRGWKAVVARVNEDGTVRDVCSGTGAGPSKEYYLNRPAVNGADDRGGAMALLAAIEVEAMRRAK